MTPAVTSHWGVAEKAKPTWHLVPFPLPMQVQYVDHVHGGYFKRDPRLRKKGQMSKYKIMSVYMRDFHCIHTKKGRSHCATAAAAASQSSSLYYMFGSSVLRHSCSVSPWQTHHRGRIRVPAAMATCVAPGSGPAAAGACKFIDLPCPDFPDLAFSDAARKCVLPGGDSEEDVDEVWAKVWEEAESDVDEEPVLRNLYHNAIFSHGCLESALAAHLAEKLGSSEQIPRGVLFEIFLDAFLADWDIQRAVRADLRAARDRDPACARMVHCLLYYKGFLACQAHRAAHRLWTSGRRVLALFVQSRVSEVFAVDIHPGARIGKGILLDHATGLVVGETAVIGDNVSILHNVTLGGTGKESGDRHPKIDDGVLVGAGTQILGNVRIGAGAKVGAGSVVLKEVPPRTTAVGNPAKLVGGKENPMRLERMASLTMDHTSWSDYVI
ncbi:hypothetical protein Taro_036495 [Colocasia esculenta]|uniref:serine O-acetyltransferase n=1 Tax=Colocasia esculenta TaxID=4460 RepID=A0A843W1Q1_COLES|nr:hypothetical protein [Colocasia esculenta]